LKVVIFCGGLGVRMGEETLMVPKPMIRIGNRPILWHIMRYYAAWGHKDFILCLGYKGEVIKEYFLTHNEALTSDFVLDGRHPDAPIKLLSNESRDWRVTFVDTGVHATIGGRLEAVEAYLEDDEIFLATYGDGLTDAPLDELVTQLVTSDKLAVFLSVHTSYNAHIVWTSEDGTVTAIEDMSQSETRINGGYFVLRREILDHIRPGDELVEETFARLIPEGRIGAMLYDGFFGPMDTIKDRQRLESLLETGTPPWEAGLPTASDDDAFAGNSAA
jgi:glucose-1-phosphate cytidylyltransferase